MMMVLRLEAAVVVVRAHRIVTFPPCSPLCIQAKQKSFLFFIANSKGGPKHSDWKDDLVR